MEIRLNILFISLLIGFAYPCSCLEPPPPEEAYEDVDIVFSGQVTNIVVDGSGGYYEVTFQTIDVWKGEILDEVIVITETNSSECGYNFQTNSEYLIYAYNYTWGIYTNICTRTNLLEYASEDLDYLNQLVICDNGYSEFNNLCFHNGDIEILQELIDNSVNSGVGDDCDPNDPYCGSPNPYMDQEDAWFWIIVDGIYYDSGTGNGFQNANGQVDPLELGLQEWGDGRLTSLMCGAYIYCQLSGEIPENISDLTEIEVLRLELNYFNGEIPESVCELENVNFNDILSFDFSYNQLCPPYPDCVPESAVNYMDTSECSECANNIEGDVTFDGEVNILDIVFLVNCILLGECDGNGDCLDINFDDEINIFDVVALVNIILTS